MRRRRAARRLTRYALVAVLIPGLTAAGVVAIGAPPAAQAEPSVSTAASSDALLDFTAEPTTLRLGHPQEVGKPLTVANELGMTLTPENSGWAPMPDSFTYQWYRNIENPAGYIPGATSSSYTPVLADANQTIGVIVTAVKAGYNPSSKLTGNVIRAFFKMPTPSIRGWVKVGETVTAQIDEIEPEPDTLTFQWLRNNGAIPGATGRTYTISEGDLGQQLSVRATATKPPYETRFRDSQKQTVGSIDSALSDFMTVPKPTIGGKIRAGSTLTAQSGAWLPEPDSFTYMWSVCQTGAGCRSAQGATFPLIAADEGKKVRLTVIGRKAGYVSKNPLSDEFLIGPPASDEREFDASPRPTIAGTARVGSTLNAVPGMWSPAPDAFDYQWLRNGAPIAGATSAAYKLVGDDGGRQVLVQVTAKKVGHRETVRESDAQTIAHVGEELEEFQTTPTPTIGVAGGGPVMVGSALTASAGAWEPAPDSLGYQWLRDGVPIPFATSVGYSPAADDEGTQLSVRVTGSKNGFRAVAKTSIAQTVAGIIDPTLQDFTAAPVPTISGAARVDGTVRAVPGEWDPEPHGLAYQWLRDGVAIPGATFGAYTLVAADQGAQLSVRVIARKPGLRTTMKLSAERAVGASDPGLQNFTEAPKPTISVAGGGAVRVGAAATVQPGAWSPVPDSFEYAWERNGVPIPGANSAVYVPTEVDAGRQLSVWITAGRAGYRETVRASSPQTVASEGQGTDFVTAPTPTVSVVGGGSARVDGLLMAAPGEWEPGPDGFSYQWLRAGAAIPGATFFAYAPVGADEGKQLSVRVTARKTGYTTTSKVSAALPVAASDPALQSFTDAPNPTLLVAGGGAVKVGAAVTVQPGAWAPTPSSLGYVWERNGMRIPGATSVSYTPVAADEGKQLTAWVTAGRDGYRTVMRVAAPTQVMPADPELLEFTTAPIPLIAGAAKVDSTMTVQPGAWTPDPDSFTYQWLRDGAAIPGAKTAVYTAVDTDEGKQISVRVTASKEGYTPAARTSEPRTVGKADPELQNFTTAPTPTIAVTGGGAVKVGSALTLQPGAWAPDPDVLAYQWLRDGASIPGATTLRYTPVALDEGTQLSVRVTAVKDGFRTTAKTSAAQQVAPADPEPVAFTTAPAPAIAVVGGGAVKAGAKMTAVPGAWTPMPDAFAYQWLRAGADITGAITAEYTLTAADAGKAISVRVTATKVGYVSTARISPVQQVAPAVPVLKRLSATPKPKISGTARVGKRLSVRAGSWKPTKVSLKYQWLRNGKAIKGATKSKYKLTRKDRGKRISVRVTGKKSGYATVSKTSSTKRVAKA